MERFGAISGRLGTYLARLDAYLPRLGAILGRLGRISASQKPPKIALKRLQDASQDELQHRSNINLNLEAFAKRKTWKTSSEEHLKQPVLEARLS